MRKSKPEKFFDAMNYMLLGLLAMITVYPLIYVFSSSISEPDVVKAGKIVLFPVGFNLSAYAEVFSQNSIWVAYANSIFYLIVGTAVNIVVTMLGAYPLSKKRFMGKGIVTFLVAFTMWFNAGIIPFYLNMKNLGLYNSRTGILIGFACSAFYVFLMRTYFQSIPDALEESAKIDGANDLHILARIYMPLSVPALVMLAVYYGVDRWNSYFWSMVLLRDDGKIPFQVLLRKLVVQVSATMEETSVDGTTISKETLIYATIVIAVLPMLMVYPYIQKYFMKGLMIGSIKE